VTIRLLFDLQPCDLKYRVEFNSESDQRNTAVIDIVSCIPSVHGKPPEIWKTDMGHLPEKLCSQQKIQNRVFCLIESALIKDKIPSKRLSVEKIITYDRDIMVHKISRKGAQKILKENLRGELRFQNKKLVE